MLTEYPSTGRVRRWWRASNRRPEPASVLPGWVLSELALAHRTGVEERAPGGLFAPAHTDTLWTQLGGGDVSPPDCAYG
jgi:hypothetical protein